jgi:hypothetical protein
MATLSELVSVLAKTTGLPPATVFAYGRFAREAGLISQKGHGRGAAQMSPTDAANLLIAVAGTGVTKEAGAAIKAFRSLSLAVWDDTLGDSPGRLLIKEWLTQLGPIEESSRLEGKPDDPRPCRLKCTFGDFVTFLIETAANSDFLGFLRKVAILEEPRFQINPDIADINFNIAFDRVNRSAQVSFQHFYNPKTEIFGIYFISSKHSRNDLQITAKIGSTIIAALGYCLAGLPFPSRVKNAEEIKRYLSSIRSKGESKPSSTLTNV